METETECIGRAGRRSRRARAALGGIRLAAVLLAGLAVAPATSVGGSPSYRELTGALHEHSAYSDGWPGSRPADYFASAKSFGLDFLGSGEHSDNADLPIAFNEGCVGPGLFSCIPADQVEPLDSLRKWEATKEQARRASGKRFTGFAGFEWSSDRYGHVNVYFSRNDTNAKADGGYVSLAHFYDWLAKPASRGGGDDGVATFNHPDDKALSRSDPAVNWEDFAYEPRVAKQMVGIEVFNGGSEYGDSGGEDDRGWYAHALDRGWRVGPIGAEDLGHDREDEWGAPRWPKTVILARDRSPQALRAALLARRFYAVRETGLRLAFAVDREPMGSVITPRTGQPVRVSARVSDPRLELELVTGGGEIVARGTGELSVRRPASSAERYYFVRARGSEGPVAYSSPVWVRAKDRPSPGGGRWLAGDLHVHTCYSHDSYCGPGDDNTGSEELYALGGSPEQRFAEASARGLDYLAITDHNDVRSIGDAGFASHGVIGVRGYESSLQGHAQMLGAERIYPAGDGTAATVRAMADELRRNGGVFQINHPAGDFAGPLPDCETVEGLDWGYGYEIPPDTVEIWNTTHLLQPPLPTGQSNATAETYWECWLQSGHRVAATGGSDSHWLASDPVNGVGQPTTWAFSRKPSEAGVLEALRRARTSVWALPPAAGEGRLVLEADGDRDGRFEAIIGDTVPPRARMRVRVEGLPVGGIVRVRANRRTLIDAAPLAPGGKVAFEGPRAEGWVRASLLLPEKAGQRAAACEPIAAAYTSFCRDELEVLGLTSPIYVARGQAPDPKGRMTSGRSMERSR